MIIDAILPENYRDAYRFNRDATIDITCGIINKILKTTKCGKSCHKKNTVFRRTSASININFHVEIFDGTQRSLNSRFATFIIKVYPTYFMVYLKKIWEDDVEASKPLDTIEEALLVVKDIVFNNIKTATLSAVQQITALVKQTEQKREILHRLYTYNHHLLSND